MNVDVYQEDRNQYQGNDPSFLTRVGNWFRNLIQNHLPFMIFVVLPTGLVFLYLTLIATPQYISEAHFVVRGRSGQSGISLSNILQSSGGVAQLPKIHTWCRITCSHVMRLNC